MNEQEIGRYLEINKILSHYKIEVNEAGLMSCPFHSNCETNVKLYEELNGIACMKESCSNYRKLFAAFEVLQKLEGIEVDAALLYGKKLLLEELEILRGKNKTREEEPKAIEKDKVLGGSLSLFLVDLEKYVKELEEPSFTRKAIEEHLRINKSTLKKYLRQLESQGIIKVIGGNRYRGGFEYRYVGKRA
jgi:predicted transcriptional regulator